MLASPTVERTKGLNELAAPSMGWSYWSESMPNSRSACAANCIMCRVSSCANWCVPRLPSTTPWASVFSRPRRFVHFRLRGSPRVALPDFSFAPQRPALGCHAEVLDRNVLFPTPSRQPPRETHSCDFPRSRIRVPRRRRFAAATPNHDACRCETIPVVFGRPRGTPAPQPIHFS